MIFPIVHFENKRNFFAAFNGGKLFVTDDEYIIRWLFFKVVRFPKKETEIVPVSDGLILQSFYFKSGKKIWELQFNQKSAKEISKFL